MTTNQVDRLDRLEVLVENSITRMDSIESLLRDSIRANTESSSKLSADIHVLSTDVRALKVDQLNANTRIEAYQKASNQVVNLAFALISAATVTVIVSSVLGR